MSQQTPPPPPPEETPPEHGGPLAGLIGWCLDNRLIVVLFTLFVIAWGITVAPFDWHVGFLPRRPVPVDAIPDIGENQQLVFTKWPGRSPQDVEDQITYPLTNALLGLSGVKTVRSVSMFGFSTVYVIFKEDVSLDTSRNRILTKLNSLPPDSMPDDVTPMLGPEATALGQIFWYTLEGRDPDGNPVGGWDLDELRSIQDWHVRFALLAAEDERNNRYIAEVGSVGGFVREYQIDVDPAAMRHYGVTLPQIFSAVRMSNIDVGARTIEVNKVEYVIRGRGFIESLEDIESIAITSRNNTPVRIRDVATIGLGPALRRGALDKAGAEAVGGVVVVRYGENPLAAINAVKSKIDEIAPALPSKAFVDWENTTRDEVAAFAEKQGFTPFQGATLDSEAWVRWLRGNPRDAWPEWATISTLTIVPFYDRTDLIYETLGTLSTALSQEILITIIVVIVMVMHLRSSLLISGLLPLAVLMCFVAMKLFGVAANIVALSGIAIAIGTMVDMGIILSENILRHLDEAAPGENPRDVVRRAAAEVGSAVLTAVSTTIVSFLPVFTMTAAEGKLFKPLAFTKTFALIASVVVAIVLIPPAAHWLFVRRGSSKVRRALFVLGLGIAGVAAGFLLNAWVGLVMLLLALYNVAEPFLPKRATTIAPYVINGAAVLCVGIVLTAHWLPLGVEKGFAQNFLFLVVMVGGLLAFFILFRRAYVPMLRAFLRVKLLFLAVPAVLIVLGLCIWLGAETVFLWVPERIRKADPFVAVAETFPGLGKEFMPPLDEGSYLYMPTTMPHASIGEALDVLQKQDMAFNAIPEVDMVVGKIGRADTPLDPAPVSMVETVITYRSEYKTDAGGRRLRFKYDDAAGAFVRNADGELIPDPDGRPFRQWRDEIRSPDDIWNAIVEAGQIPGTTSAPKLQPIAARIVMLQSGMRAPMGIKVKGPDLETIERVGIQLEQLLKQVPSVASEMVIADRIVGKPYIEITPKNEPLGRYGLRKKDVQDIIEVAIGGRPITRTVEGRERYPVRVRYKRELRDQIEDLGEILVPAKDGTQIPLIELADIEYVRGPQAIKSEDTFLVGYVLFDKKEGQAEVDVVEDCKAFIAEKEASGEFVRPAGVEITFAGTYENQIRSARTLAWVMPLALFVIFIILYLQFRAVSTTWLIFTGILIAWSGGFLLIWLYGQPWFMNFALFGANMRELFQMHPINLSVAIWVGFLALFGIATDDGVVIATYLDQSFRRREPETVPEIRRATVVAASRRIRPCLMTSATTILALVPVLTSTGRGSDVMVPMAIPSFGGMLVVLISVFTTPVLYCLLREFKHHTGLGDGMTALLSLPTLFLVPAVYCAGKDLGVLWRRVLDEP